MPRAFTKRDLVTAAPIVLGVLAMIPESTALENTRAGLSLFWTAFAPAAAVGAVFAYVRARVDARAEVSRLDRASELVTLAIGFGLLSAAFVSILNHAAVTEPRRVISAVVLDKWETRTSHTLLVDWDGVEEELHTPIDVWRSTEPGRYRIKLVVFPGRLGFDVLESY